MMVEGGMGFVRGETWCKSREGDGEEEVVREEG